MNRRNRVRVALAVALVLALVLASSLAASGAVLAEPTTESAERSEPAAVPSTAAALDGDAGPTQIGGDGAGGEPSGETDGESADGSAAQRSSNGSVEPMTACFTGDGYPISIGETGATLDALVHLSVLTDPSVGNEFGIEAAGTLEDDSIVTLAAGVRLTAREALADGIDPFAAFDILYTYELRLPMFSGSIDDTEYRDSGSPFRSSAGVVPC